MDILMPQLGETVSEGTVSSWHKAAGEAITAKELLFEVETDKVTMEVPAPVDGTLVEILVAEGETVPVGTKVGIVEPIGGTAEITTPSNPSTATDPDSSSSDNHPLSPAVRKLVAEHSIEPTLISGTGRDGRITKGDVLSYLDARTSAPNPALLSTKAANKDAKGNPLSPVVRRLLSEHSLSPDGIPGTGENGRIKRDDVLAHLASSPGSSVKTGGDRTIIPLSKIRKLIGDHMVASKATSPHVLQAVEVDFSRIDKARANHGDGWKASHGYSLTYLPFIARAVCKAISEFPYINASIEAESLVLHRRINLGIAVDLGFEGLIVPVLKDAQTRTVQGLAEAIRDLSGRARSNGLGADDLTEGTYTLSNSGPFGTMITAPVINQPQVAILSTDGVRKKPWVIESEEGDSIGIRPIGVLAQSFDHRAFDGAYSAAYLNRLREIIETTSWTDELA
jgi:pyruvate dehydrogenase E2 component (dihydrolipoamide acetyltransferase)